MDQCAVEAWSSVGDDIDAFVEVAETGDLGNAGLPGQAVHTAALAKPAPDRHGLTERAEPAGAA
ncbi:hypothetical protein GCM10009540_36940 [Streptomyces turgidiscabies]